ncbi:UNVERIFIED_CONTAM: Centromere/kinetochore protein zw10 [Sesamum calycinum]|uniref:Centromere/kinetochore protein zw10 n=1 Tax=Sesamum calycinum TaxID=2727403 RepID=A0AAW2Q343_9LAMI
MDVLFNSINVRDLLSSLESPSSPLSAPDLRLLISRLDAHSLRIKSTVQSYLLSHHDDFSSLFSQCSDVVSKSERLSDDVVALLNLISDQPIESDVGRIFREIVEKTRESREKREILEFVEVVLELDRKLGVVSNNVKNGKVAEAAEGLKELKIALGVKGNGDAEAAEGEPVVYGILKKHWSDCFEEIQELLWRFMENAVWFEQEGNEVHIKYQTNVNGIDGLELQTVLKALDVADILDYGLARIADLITKYVFTPVGNKVDGEVMYSNIVQIVEFIYKFLFFHNGSWMRCFGRLTWQRMSDMIIANFLSKELCLAIYLIPPQAYAYSEKAGSSLEIFDVVEWMEMLSDRACDNLPERLHGIQAVSYPTWNRMIGKWWEMAAATMVVGFRLGRLMMQFNLWISLIFSVVPDDASKLAEFQVIRKLTIDFETALKQLMFISQSDIKDEKLSKFADNVEVHFAARKKVQILAKARNMLLQSNFSLPQNNITRISAVNKEELAEEISNRVVLLFSSEKCVISEAAKQLMELVHQTLKDVCVLPPKVGLEFYHTARNALLLYEAIIPVKLQRQLDSINQAAVLIHNDCLYLSQEVLGLAFEVAFIIEKVQSWEPLLLPSVYKEWP